jgi:sugar/nucleoside kinase (ribokinase family)
MSEARNSQAAVIVGGTIAIDHVKTPDSEATDLLGGSAAYAALAASFFSRPVSLVGIIGHDFPQEHLDMLENRGVSLDGVERSES